jgi:hypothetical protein
LATEHLKTLKVHHMVGDVFGLDGLEVPAPTYSVTLARYRRVLQAAQDGIVKMQRSG